MTLQSEELKVSGE